MFVANEFVIGTPVDFIYGGEMRYGIVETVQSKGDNQWVRMQTAEGYRTFTISKMRRPGAIALAND